MSITRTATPAGRPRPSRRVQLVVWALFAVALVTGFATSGYLHAGGTAAPAADVTVAAPSSSLTIAAGAPGSDTPRLRNTYADDATGLLPAYRWRSAVALPSDYGVGDRLAPGGDDVGSMFADLMFALAAWTWWLLLSIVKFAVGMDLVTNAAAEIDGGFRAAASGLGKSGLPLVAVVAAVALAAMRVLRGKLNQSVSLILGAALVVGALSFFTAAAKGPMQTFNVSGTTVKAASVGSPAYIAQRGNAFVNTVVGQVTSGFGAANVLNKKVVSGEFATKGDTDGATCNYYIKQLYATHDIYAKAGSGSVAGLQADALAMVSYMWQRGLYDNWTLAAFGSLSDGARIACHRMEASAGIQAMDQFAIVGGESKGGEATAGPYKGMNLGPFAADISNQIEDQRAARLAWAGCGGSNGQKARAGWDKAGRVTDAACEDWWNWVPGDKSIGEKVWDIVPGTGSEAVGINSGDAENVLVWDNMSQLRASTTWDGTGTDADAAALSEVHTVVSSYYGENGGQRLFAGLMALIAAALYAWAFGAASLGTIITQIGLLFLLTLLPYTLLLLAFPTKDGGRSKAGVRMLKMTGAFFAGKAVFLALLGVTVQLMSTLFTVASSFSGASGTAAASGSLVLAAGNSAGMSMVWSLIIPAATIFILRMATKSLGLGDLMSLSGAAGFATSAVLSGKENKKARSQFQGGLNGSLVGKTLNRADKGVKRGLTAPGRAAKNRLAKEYRGGKLAKAVRDGKISQEQLERINQGKTTLAKELAANKLATKNPDLSPTLQRAVAAGHMTLGQARAVARAQRKQAITQEPEIAPEIGGFAGAQQRLGELGTGETADGPVFASTLTATADRDKLRQAQTDRRSDLAIRNKGVDEAGWEANALEDALTSMEALRAGGQGVEIGVSLSPAQVAAEKARLANELAIPENLVLLGSSSGLPPLIAPAVRNADGSFNWPENISDDLKIKLAMNPLNFLDIERSVGESADQLHARAVLELHAAGGIDLEGNFADVLAAEKIDVNTVDGRQEVLAAMAGKSTTLRLEDIKLTVPEADRGVIATVVREHYPATHYAEAASRQEQVASVSGLAGVANRQAETVQVELAQTVNHVLERQGTPEFAREMDKVLRVIEERIPEAVTDLGAITLEARLTDDWVSGSVDDQAQMMSAAKAMSKLGESMVNDLQRDLTNAVAQIKLTVDPDQQADLLKALSRDVQERMGAATSDMESNVERMLTRAADEARTREQQLASQLRAPVRASDFSGGASDLP